MQNYPSVSLVDSAAAVSGELSVISNLLAPTYSLQIEAIHYDYDCFYTVTFNG